MPAHDAAKANACALFLVLLCLYLPESSQAKENYLESLSQCPVVAPIRVASASSLGDFLSLKPCSGQMVFAPPAAIAGPPPTARIAGVKAAAPPVEENKVARPCRKCTAHTAPAGHQPLLFDGLIRETAGAYRIDPLFLHALAWTESAYRPDAVSSAGARGLMQIMPATGRDLGVAREHLFDPRINIDASARLLKRLQRRYGRDIPLILAAYNAGEGAVEKHGRRIPPYRETQAYVRTVMRRYGRLRGVETAR